MHNFSGKRRRRSRRNWDLFFGNQLLESLLEHGAVAATAARVDEDNNRRLWRLHALAVAVAFVEPGLAGGGVLEPDGVAHGEPEVLRHQEAPPQLLLVNPHPRQPAPPKRLYHGRPRRDPRRFAGRRRLHFPLSNTPKTSFSNSNLVRPRVSTQNEECFHVVERDRVMSEAARGIYNINHHS